jgi:peptidyl-dipeptidase A
MHKLFTACVLILAISACDNKKHQSEAQAFIDSYTKEYVRLYTASSEAQWAANTKIIAGDSTNAKAVERTGEAFADFTGSKENIENAQNFLKQQDQLNELQVKQLQKILYFAANNLYGFRTC